MRLRISRSTDAPRVRRKLHENPPTKRAGDMQSRLKCHISRLGHGIRCTIGADSPEQSMNGIVVAGRTGARRHPITPGTSKPLHDDGSDFGMAPSDSR